MKDQDGQCINADLCGDLVQGAGTETDTPTTTLLSSTTNTSSDYLANMKLDERLRQDVEECMSVKTSEQSTNSSEQGNIPPEEAPGVVTKEGYQDRPQARTEAPQGNPLLDTSNPMLQSIAPLPAAPPPMNEVHRKPGAYAEAARPIFLSTQGSTITTTDSHSGCFAASRSAPLHASTATSISSGLIEARLVNGSNRSLEEAKPVEEKKTASHSILYALFGFTVTLLFLTGLTLLIVWSSGSLLSAEDAEATSFPPLPSAPSTNSPETYLQDILPSDTLQRIHLSASSPQSLAYQWMIQDPNLHAYTPDRLFQRLALATVYYSTNGPTTWTRDDFWLSYKVNECDWYLSPHYDLLLPKPVQKDSACDDKGTIVRLWLFNNTLSGILPEELYELLPSLQSLDLMSNHQLAGTVSTQIHKLSSLTELCFRRNALNGTFPSQVGALTQLTTLVLGEQDLQGSFPRQAFRGLTNLKQLALGGMGHTGNIPTEMGLLTNLVAAGIVGTRLSGRIPSQMGQMSKLQYLWIGFAQLSGSLPVQLGNLSHLKWLNFAHNRLTGSVPSFIGMLPSLQELVLAQNQLSSTIPTELGLLTRLYEMDLQGNQLTGELPTHLGNLQGATYMSFSNNQIAGSIPQVGELRALEYLGLAQNQLSGSLPSTLGQLERLQEMWLQENDLTGVLPSQLGLLRDSLSQWDLSGNQFSPKETWSVLSMQNATAPVEELSQQPLHHPV